MKRLATIVLILFTLTACTNQPGRGEYHEWFNPNGEKVEDVVPADCTPGDFPVPPDLNEPPPVGMIPAGWVSATYHLNVDAIFIRDPGGPHNREYCIPVAIHVYASANAIPADMMVTDSSGVHLVPTPWDGLRNTPWRATIVVAWDPRYNAPVMNFDLIAKFEQGQGLTRIERPAQAGIGLSCRLRQNEATFAMTFSTDIFLPTGEERQELTVGPTVRCRPAAFTAIPM